MSKKKNNDVKMNNMLMSIIMLVIGLAGVFVLSRSIVYQNNYLDQVHLSENCVVMYKNDSVTDIKKCMDNYFAEVDNNRVQAQILEVAGTAMISVAVVSSVTILQVKRS